MTDQHKGHEPSGGATARPGYLPALFEELRVLAVAGVATGVVVVGGGSRVAMLLLRLTSPANVRGVTSDDGFTIGRVTLAGTYNLVMLGGAVGVVGAAAYQWVRPWLLGSRWFRLLTLALGSAAVVGAMLVHGDGVDFTLLKPTWFAVGLFITLPAVFAVAIAVAVNRVEGEASWTRRRVIVWLLPLLLVAAVPPVLFVLAIAMLVLGVRVSVREEPSVQSLPSSRGTRLVMRSLWLGVALLGLVALLRDVAALRRLG